MKTNEKNVYGKFEISVLEDIQEWALKKYGKAAFENLDAPPLQELTEEYWKEMLE